MYKYEYLNEKARECLAKVDQFKGDIRLVAFYENAAKGFVQRAARLTLAEAMVMVDDKGDETK